MDFGDHFVDYCSFTLDETGPDALVLGLGRRGLVMVGLGMDAEQAFHDLLGGPNARLAVRRTQRSLRGGLTMGMPLPSTATTRIEAAGEEGSAGRWA